jgi:hypothetical protein
VELRSISAVPASNAFGLPVRLLQKKTLGLHYKKQQSTRRKHHKIKKKPELKLLVPQFYDYLRNNQPTPPGKK